MKKMLLFLLFLSACSSVDVKNSGPVPSLDVPLLATPPVIDGKLDDPAWKDAAVIKGLRSSRGKNYQDKIDKIPTTIRVLWDENYLYVGFECIDADIYSSGKMKHDEDLYKEDVCEVFIDGKGDGRQYVEIQATPDGESLDLMYVFTGDPEYTSELRMTPEFCDKERWGFREWNMEGLRTAGSRIERDGKIVGWSVEMAIPAAAVVKRQGLKNFVPMEIRANFMRYDWPADEKTGKRDLLHMNWSPVLKGCPHISPSSMGRLVLKKD
ncbi:MAG TPA: hypothetical protein DET40_03465 [Lentisphaeria bacterium]|nr:MAG: hypothetical protein A2X45_22030 [Lentisphaerae bacterium GWF2_50_93]HCE42587.1 hypothetical protein [Lentisphaeria bacterium]